MSNIHDKLVVIDTSPIMVMTGAVSLDGSETVLGKGGKTLPNEVRASMGTKFFMDRAVLKKLQGCRNRLVSYLGSVAVRYLGGYAAPIELKDQILKKVADEKATFEGIKQELVTHYDEYVDKWCSQFPDCSQELKASAPSLEKVEARNRFGVNVFQVQPLTGEQAIAADSQIGETLLDEVSKDARNLYCTSFRGKTECSRKALSAIERLARKLQGLAFLDNRALPLATDVFNRIGQLPKHGPYSGTEFTEVTNICLLLAYKPDLNQEQALVEKAAAEGTNFVPTTGNSEANKEEVMACGVEDSDRASGKTEVKSCSSESITGKPTGEREVEPEKAQSASAVSSDDDTLDLFKDLDTVLDDIGSNATSRRTEKNEEKQVTQPETLKTPQADSANDSDDDYFSDQFA